MIDDHLEGEGESDGDEDGDDAKNKSKRPKMSEEERERLRQEIKQAVINAASSSEAGSIPKGVERLIKDMTNPVMPWRDLIQINLTSAIRTDFSWMRPSRRSWHMDAIMPGMTPGQEIDVVVAIDMSGSISDKQAQAFLAEVGGMMESFDGYRVHVFCFDTEIYNPQHFNSENFRHLVEQENVPKRLIVFTDGLPFGSWGTEDYCDTLWIIHGSKDIVPPWGTYAYYDEHKKN
jgi:predicted metal-dependent peptidase